MATFPVCFVFYFSRSDKLLLQKSQSKVERRAKVQIAKPLKQRFKKENYDSAVLLVDLILRAGAGNIGESEHTSHDSVSHFRCLGAVSHQPR